MFIDEVSNRGMLQESMIFLIDCIIDSLSMQGVTSYACKIKRKNYLLLFVEFVT